MIKKLLNSIFYYTSLLLITVGIANESSAQCTTTPVDQNFTAYSYPNFDIQTVEEGCIRYSMNGDAVAALGITQSGENSVFQGNSLIFSGTTQTTYCQFETTNPNIKFRMNSTSIEFYSHTNGSSSQLYNIVGYNGTDLVAKVTGFNTQLIGEQGDALGKVSFNRVANPVSGTTTGTLTFLGTGWRNVSKVVFEKAESTRALAIDLDNIDFEPAVTGTLPITLQTFDATVKNNGVLLNWKSATEVNNKQYLISHSTDGVNYKLLTEIPSNNQFTYSYTHLLPAAGRNYYKLQQQDLSGELNDVEVKVVTFTLTDDAKITFYPNPATDYLNLRFEKKEFKAVDLVNVNGRIVYSQPIHENDYDLKINVSSFPKGIYFLKMRDYNNKMVSKKFIKK